MTALIRLGEFDPFDLVCRASGKPERAMVDGVEKAGKIESELAKPARLGSRQGRRRQDQTSPERLDKTAANASKKDALISPISFSNLYLYNHIGYL
ncbi:hypothetical protein [Sphingomonas crocodyli]|uniref:hypothetical protein n=1 Tax=Sphingomonas crocodyli TaxID=1979270 RepID=UPI0013E33F0E|nr:hypothetical protein [Sphingomonas crocodyli]